MFKRNKGFTMAELLVVVAMIAVLVAIAIPIFAGKLNSAKNSTDAANTRAAYAEAMSNLLFANPAADGSRTATSDYTVKSSGGDHTDEGWNNGSLMIGTVSIPAPSADAAKLQLSVDEDDNITVAWVS